ncbi:hypothetical protein GWK47_037392 [Chionoecetes opilio]|uniref:Uncharacterized protein n=1 Tax=Chionoecetes opilio TaxID=41210 RepID=A0A8J4YSK9_CHIOP|nr:hypothetical protein GWK47_037392 [Chionoecetes opilio]
MFLPLESSNERGTMSLTTLLVFISLYTESSNSLPTTAYLKYIDVWFVFSITYLSVIIIVHLATFSHCPPSPTGSKVVAWPPKTDSTDRLSLPGCGATWKRQAVARSSLLPGKQAPAAARGTGLQSCSTTRHSLPGRHICRTGIDRFPPTFPPPRTPNIRAPWSFSSPQGLSRAQIAGLSPVRARKPGESSGALPDGRVPARRRLFANSTSLLRNHDASLSGPSRVLSKSSLKTRKTLRSLSNSASHPRSISRRPGHLSLSLTPVSLLALLRMACTSSAAVATLFGLLALTQAQASVAGAQVYSSHSGSAQSQVTEPDGTIKGECAYLDPQGRNVKISYRQSPGGQIEAASDPPMQNTAGALQACRSAAEAASRAAQESFQHTQKNIFRQQQDLQQQIFRQNQAFQQSFQYPRFFQFPQDFPFGR